MEIPLFYDDLDLSLAKAWDLIEPGATRRTSAAHTPVVATVDRQGCPQMRIMVLREANRGNRRLRFHTDARAAKTGEVANNAGASVLIYDPAEKAQVRLQGLARVITEGDEVDAAWNQSTPFSRRCYMAETSPGSVSPYPTSGLPDWIEGKQPDETDLLDARVNFAILLFEVHSIEWLYLANAGHRRAIWDWQENDARWSGRWLVP